MSIETRDPSNKNLDFINPGMSEELEYYSGLVDSLIRKRNDIEVEYKENM